MCYGCVYYCCGAIRNPNVGNDSSALELSADWWNHAVTLWSPSDEDGVDTPDTAAVAAASEEETPGVFFFVSCVVFCLFVCVRR